MYDHPPCRRRHHLLPCPLDPGIPDGEGRVTDAQSKAWVDFVATVMAMWDTRCMDTRLIGETLRTPEHIVAMALRVGREERYAKKAAS